MVRLLSLCTLILAVWPSFGQTRVPSFNLVTGTNGIMLGKVNAVVRDSYGFLWLSDQTNHCIVRYDGNYMKRYSHSPGKANTLGGHYPECLAADRDSTLWIGFYGQGIDHFDPVRGTFQHYAHNPDDPGSLSNDVVSAVLVDRLGNLWVGTDGGLNLLDRATGKFTHFRNDPGDSLSLSFDLVRSIYEDRDGVLWVGTGMAFNADPRGGLNRLDRSTGKFTRFVHEPGNPNSLADNRVRAIFEDSWGSFWIGTSGDGLHKMDKATGRIERLTSDPSKPGKLARPPVVASTDHITFITEGSDRNLWIGTLSNGTVRYDPRSSELIHYGRSNDPSGAYRDNSSWLAYPTGDGHMWLSTQSSNLFRIDLYTQQFPTVRMGVDTFLLSYYEETADVTWLGTTGGAIREDASSRSRRYYTHHEGDINSISGNIVNSIYKDGQGVLWFGTDNGLNRFDPVKQRFVSYRSNEQDTTSLPGNTVFSILEDSHSRLWVGTNNGAGWLDREKGTFQSGFRVPIAAMVETEGKYLWLASDQALGRVTLDSGGEVKGYIWNHASLALHQDDQGTLWAGTNSGLYRYDREADDFVNQGIDATINYILSDSSALWMTSSTLGLIRFNPSDRRYTFFGKESGLLPEMMTNSQLYKSHDGRLVIRSGLITEAFVFDPSLLVSRSDSSALYFTGLSMLSGTQEATDHSSADSQLIAQSTLDLDYDESTFAIRFTEVDFRNLGNARIHYLLEGYDGDWRQAFPEEAVSYFRVPPGTYTFRIKAANGSSGIWSEKSLTIRVASPWWTTWWAYGLYAGLFAGGVYAVDRIQRKRISERQKALAQERELEQAREIEKAYNELKATQAQLIQSEKMASLGELTAGIAHEIQNPLNFVNNFSEVNTELLDELKDELAKGNGQSAISLAETIRGNQDKITHHGKRADGIVKGMLQHSRASSGQKEPTDINALCEEYLRLAYHGLRAKDKSFNAKFESSFDESIGKVNVVPQDIGRAVLNLITNAFHAVSEKSASAPSGFVPTVTVRTRRPPHAERRKGDLSPSGGGKGLPAGQAGEEKIEISIKDNGYGIPDSIKQKIFQPFFTTKPSGKGTGLGLSITYDIVKAQGGEITVQTREGEGTEFCITLPV
jgi:signal transduction histidine kinase/ligand-binding sensor domain-containing protein